MLLANYNGYTYLFQETEKKMKKMLSYFQGNKSVNFFVTTLNRSVSPRAFSNRRKKTADTVSCNRQYRQTIMHHQVHQAEILTHQTNDSIIIHI